MELHRPFGSTKLRPIKHRGAKIDHRGVQTQQRVLTPLLVGPSPTRSLRRTDIVNDTTARSVLALKRRAVLPSANFPRANEHVLQLARRGASEHRGRCRFDHWPWRTGLQCIYVAYILKLRRCS